MASGMVRADRSHLDARFDSGARVHSSWDFVLLASGGHTMKPAVRISRVRMKNGGADVRVLHRDTQGGVLAEHMRCYVTECLNKERPPDAYAAVALWFDAHTPGRPRYNVTYCTTN